VSPLTVLGRRSLALPRQSADPPAVRVDESMLLQVLQNLVSKGENYSPAGIGIFVQRKCPSDGVGGEVKYEGSGLSRVDQDPLVGQLARLSAVPALQRVYFRSASSRSEFGAPEVLGKSAQFQADFP